MKDRKYVILRKNRMTGEVSGYCEHSFCMGWDKDRVKPNGCVLDGAENTQRYYEEYYLKKELWKKRQDDFNEYGQKAMPPNQRLWFWLRRQVYKLSKKFNGYEVKCFRLGSKECPIEVDWAERKMMKNKKMKYDKYKWINIPFKVKYPEKW